MRGLRESQRFMQQVEDMGGAKRLDEITEGVRWALARNAECFPVIPGTDLRQVNVVATLDSPPLVIFVSIDDSNDDDGQVDLLWIERRGSDPEEPSDEH